MQSITLAMKTVVTVIRFEPYNEEVIEQYFERLEIFLMVRML